jgi:hypothetical protein
MLNLSFLTFLSQEIADFTNNKIGKDSLVWSNIVNQDGSVAIPQSSIAITLVKIEKETVIKTGSTG